VTLSTEPRALLLEDNAILTERGSDPPAARAMDELHERAIRARASDIHLEPTHDGGRARQRVDGFLAEVRTFTPELFAQVVSRVKLLAAMDIADRRQPQDGRYSISQVGHWIDARVSSMPTIEGEKIVIRLLDSRARVPSLERLGMPPDMLERYRRLVHSPHGFIVVCGPTGSGKTTTLYASLAERNIDGQHLCTVEDPVEIRMSGVAQVQVNIKAGLTFATALRSFLRADPNLIMVGEMRDAETASVAMSAALSGQLVMTSLHASDAGQAVERLSELGIRRQALAAGLTGVVAQRLVRELCSTCRFPVALDGPTADALGIDRGVTVFEAQGCARCAGSGYVGRTGVFEYLPITAELAEAIARDVSSRAIGATATGIGYEPMRFDGIRRALRGETSIAELLRVLPLGDRA
jgi:type II secretory ATPase GspE/PulE/Tfp pilus assembly ATPase PilB-like protein